MTFDPDQAAFSQSQYGRQDEEFKAIKKNKINKKTKTKKYMKFCQIYFLCSILLFLATEILFI